MVILVDDQSKEEAVALAERFGLSLQENPPQENHLCLKGSQWSVQGGDFSIKADFNEALKRLSRQRLSAKKDLLARSVGLDKNPGARILDATLGLGKDAFHLAYLGANVVGVERDPVPFILVESALKNAPVDAIKGSIECHFGRTEEFLEEAELQFDALYLDPMFEDIEKKSLPKKEMQFLRSRQREKGGETEIIERALRKGIERIVVKRPLKGSELYPGPKMKLIGKMIRYDIYQLRP